MLSLSQTVGKNCANRPDDVKALHKCLMQIGKVPCYECGGLDDHIVKGVREVQQHFMLSPDGIVTANGSTHRFLSDWEKKSVNQGVQLPGRLQEAWNWVDPLLPRGSSCTSGYRSADAQRRILHGFFLSKWKMQIMAKYGAAKYNAVNADLLKNEALVLEMVRGVGQAIAAPGKSAHQKGKAIDVGGPDAIDAKQVEVIKLVAKAHPGLFSGKVLKERNGCVHFEIL